MKLLITLLLLNLNLAFAQLIPTPQQTEGPFYPGFSEFQHVDNNLIKDFRVKGEKIILNGSVVDSDGRAISNALVHIWQTDSLSGRYFNDDQMDPLDPHFQYFGKNTTDSNGKFLFLSVRPKEYPVTDEWIRPDHIHVAVYINGRRKLTTQIYFSDDPLLGQDLILQRMNAAQRQNVIVDYKKLGEFKLGDLRLIL